MNVNKKLGRLRQWGKEKMGGEVKTAASEDFKALETEMNLRQDGLEKMHGSMTAYVKSLSKRAEGENKEKSTAIASLASSMTHHGGDFEQGSKFGDCLLRFGQANERIARSQDSYAVKATSSWLDALERSLAQMRDYQNARKKLESRRLAYDTSLAKIQKAKKEDYRAEEELRSQKAKYEESTEDVYRRMQDIIESEPENTAELHSFLEAELSYHDRCREILQHLKNEWPGETSPSKSSTSHFQGPRSREGTISRVTTNSSTTSMEQDNEWTQTLRRPSAPFHQSSRVSSASSSPQREHANPMLSRALPSDLHPVRTQTPLSAIPSHEMPHIRPTRSARGHRTISKANIFDDDGDSSSSPEMPPYWESSSTTRSSSPATTISHGTNPEACRSRKSSLSTVDVVREGAFGSNNANTGVMNGAAVGSVTGTVKKVAPPPPPSRASKPRPPPPPPPMNRSAASTSAVPNTGI